MIFIAHQQGHKVSEIAVAPGGAPGQTMRYPEQRRWSTNWRTVGRVAWAVLGVTLP